MADSPLSASFPPAAALPADAPRLTAPTLPPPIDLLPMLDQDAYFQPVRWFYGQYGRLPLRRSFFLSGEKPRTALLAQLAASYGDLAPLTLAHTETFEEADKGAATLPHYFCWLEFSELRQSVVIAPLFVRLRG